MSGGFQIRNQHALHFITLTIVGWVDVLTRDIHKQTLIQSLKYCCENKGLHICAWVFMSNHLHLIVYADETSRGLSYIIADFKKFSSKAILKQINSNKESRREWMLRVFEYHGKYNARNRKYQFWIQNNHPVEIYSPKWITRRLNYIHNNPVRANIVAKPEHYLYSSAIDYVGGKGLLDVEIIDLGVTEGYIHM